MLDLELSWRAAAVTSGALAVAVIAVRRRTSPRVLVAAAVGREASILLALFALWQFAGSYSVISPDGAIGRAQWLWNTERAIRLPSETALQNAFLPHPLLIQFFNLYYAALHFPVLVGMLIWLFARYRSRYPRVRATVVLFTAASLLIQLIPVAPPRMLAGDNMIDTALQYGQSVYGSVAGFNADQLSAMPSVHVGWAILVALVIVQVSRSKWRWLALLYPVFTTLAVVVTANHFWMDGIVAAMLLALVLLVQRAWLALRRAVAASARQPATSRTVFAHTGATAPPPAPGAPPAAAGTHPAAAGTQPARAAAVTPRSPRPPSPRSGGAAEASSAAADGPEARREAPSSPQ
jgi:PAP2 superfamily